jgi:hypothetical protein
MSPTFVRAGVESSDKLKYHWALYNDDGRQKVDGVADDVEGTLTLAPIKPAHSGTYHCYADDALLNRVGHSSVAVVVRRQGLLLFNFIHFETHMLFLHVHTRSRACEYIYPHLMSTGVR